MPGHSVWGNVCITASESVMVRVVVDGDPELHVVDPLDRRTAGGPRPGVAQAPHHGERTGALEGPVLDGPDVDGHLPVDDRLRSGHPGEGSSTRSYDHSSLCTPTGGGWAPSPSAAAGSPRWPWLKAGELTQALNASSSRQRVTTSQVPRSSFGPEEVEALEALGIVHRPGPLGEPLGQLVARPLPHGDGIDLHDGHGPIIAAAGAGSKSPLPALRPPPAPAVLTRS